MYVLDEPSIGLHQRDNDRLIGTLKHLRDIGNSVLVVEHDEDMIRAADHVIDMGPAPAFMRPRHGAGTFAQVQANPRPLTGKYLAGTLKIAVPKQRTPWLPTVKNARAFDQSSRACAQSGDAARCVKLHTRPRWATCRRCAWSFSPCHNLQGERRVSVAC
jgi:excinuclease ABC subunit A